MMETLTVRSSSPRSSDMSSMESYANQMDELRHQLKRAEEANYRLAATLELVPVATCVLDSKARLLFINSVGARILGLPNAQHLIGKAFPSCYTHWARELLIKTALPRAARSGNWEGELSLIDAMTGRDVRVNQQIHAQRRPDNSLFFSLTFHRTDILFDLQQQTTTPTTQPSTTSTHNITSKHTQSALDAATTLASAMRAHCSTKVKEPQSEEDEGPSASKDKSVRHSNSNNNSSNSNNNNNTVKTSSSIASTKTSLIGSSRFTATASEEEEELSPRPTTHQESWARSKHAASSSSAELLFSAMQSTTFGLCIVKQNGDHWSYEYSNSGFQKMSGYSEQELRGKPVFSLWTSSEINQPSLCLLQSALQDGKECAVEMVLSCKGNSLARCRISASPLPQLGRSLFFFTKYQETDSPGSSTGHILSFTDDEAVFSKIFESLDVGMLVWSRENHGINRRRFRLLAINNKCDAYGVAAKAKTVVGKYFDEINPELVDSGLLDTYDKVLDSGKPCHIGLVPLQHKDYKPALFNVTGFPISETLLGIIFDQVDSSASMKPGIPYYPASHQRFVERATVSSAPSSPPSTPNPALELPPLLPAKTESPSRKRARPDSPLSPMDNERTLPPLDRALQFSSNFVSTETRVHRDAFETHPLACALLTPGGNFAQVNSTFCHLLGYRKDDLVGTPLDSVLPQEETHAVSTSFVQLLNSSTSSSRFNLRTYSHKQGKTALCLETMWIVRGNAQSPVSSPPSSPVSTPSALPASSTDLFVMLLIQPVGGLKERFPDQFGERIFLKSFAASPVAAGIFGKEGRLQEINPALSALLGYSNPRELEGRGFEAFIHSDDLETVSMLPCQMVKSGLPSSQVIVRCKQRDGATLFCLMYLSLINDELTGLTTHLVAHIQSMSALEQLFRY